MAKIQLTNVSSMPFEASLHHHEFCKSGGPCECVDTTYTHSVLPRVVQGVPRPGRVDTEIVKVPKTLRISPNQSVEIHEAVLGVPYINDAVNKRKVLKLKRVRDVVAPIEPVDETAPDLRPVVSDERSRKSRTLKNI